MKSGMIDRVVLVGVCVLLAGSGMVRGEIFEVPLDCAGEYGVGDVWTVPIDLGVTFSEITSVGIDWSGEICATVIADAQTGSPEIPIDGQFFARLYESSPYHYFGEAIISGGGTTYPGVFLFTEQSLLSATDWVELTDGIANMAIWFYDTRPATMDHVVVEEGSGELIFGTLIVEGTVVPEPGTLGLVVVGAAVRWRTKGRRWGCHT